MVDYNLLKKINYFILTYQGLSIFENNYDKNLNSEVNLNIIDN